MFFSWNLYPVICCFYLLRVDFSLSFSFLLELLLDGVVAFLLLLLLLRDVLLLALAAEDLVVFDDSALLAGSDFDWVLCVAAGADLRETSAFGADCGFDTARSVVLPVDLLVVSAL